MNSLKKILQKTSDLLFVMRPTPSMSLNAGLFQEFLFSEECQTRQVRALQCLWALDLSCPLSDEGDQMMPRCPKQPVVLSPFILASRITQDSIQCLSGEAPELASELETGKSLANTENPHNY